MVQINGVDLYHADLLYAVRRRNLRPQGVYYKSYSPDFIRLINESAPERDIDLLNPYSEKGEYFYNKGLTFRSG
jgi:hypothetical protein